MSHFADIVGSGLGDLESLVRAHLKSGCFPPVDPCWAPAAVLAINHAADYVESEYAYDIDKPLRAAPNGMSVREIVDGLNLGAFVGAVLAARAEVPNAFGD